MTSPDTILMGALDLHAHLSPEFTPSMPGRVSNVEWARLASAAQLRGYVIKSHVFPTMSVVNSLSEMFPELEIFSSITLNPTAGGLDPMTVELAIESGARVVWMPTWSARATGSTKSIFLERMRRYVGSVDPAYWPVHGLDILGADGKLKPEVDRIAEICAERGAVVAGGHLPADSSLVLCERVVELGGTFVLTHPLNGAVKASIEQQQQIVELGGWIEHVFITCMPMHHRVDPHSIVECIEAIGPEHCIMATDSIEAWNPPQPELFRMFIATMLALGVDANAVHAMTHDNPASVMGLPNQWSPPPTAATAPDTGASAPR